MQHLNSPSPLFNEKKTKILDQLAVPNSEYSDASPKGSVDEGIRDLIDEINCAQGFVTTSSCAGRISVFLEGRKTRSSVHYGGGDNNDNDNDNDNDNGGGNKSILNEQVAGVGGKGAGGTWLYVSHEAYDDGGGGGDGEETYLDWMTGLGLSEAAEPVCISMSKKRTDSEGNTTERRLIHFKFEPMILHVLTTSLTHAQLLLKCALQAGFRESGALNITPQTNDQTLPMVAIRSMGLGLESLIGYEESNGQRRRTVPPEYLKMLIQISNDRFVENTRRIERFRTAFRDAVLEPKAAPVRKNPEGKEWEDAATRRERMRAEGLQRKAAAQKVQKDDVVLQDDVELDWQIDPSD